MFGYKSAALSLAVLGASMYAAQDSSSAFMAEMPEETRELQWDDLDDLMSYADSLADSIDYSDLYSDWDYSDWDYDWDYSTYDYYSDWDYDWDYDDWDYDDWDYDYDWDDWDYSDYYSYDDWEDFEDAAGTAIGIIIFVWIMIPVCCVCGTIIGIWACCTGCWGKCKKKDTTVVIAGGAGMGGQPAVISH